MCIEAFAAKIPVLGKRYSRAPQEIVEESTVTKKPKYDSDPNMNPEGNPLPQNVVAMPAQTLQ
jgi:hypothetical protein